VLPPEKQTIRQDNSGAEQIPTPAKHAGLAQVEPSVEKQKAIDNTVENIVPEAGQLEARSLEELIKERMLAIDPRATFIVIDPMLESPIKHTGPVAADLAGQGFAQHVGRSVYAIHAILAPQDHEDKAITGQYKNGRPNVTIPTPKKDTGKGRS
jgi:hypothetical protein